MNITQTIVFIHPCLYGYTKFGFGYLTANSYTKNLIISTFTKCFTVRLDMPHAVIPGSREILTSKTKKFPLDECHYAFLIRNPGLLT